MLLERLPQGLLAKVKTVEEAVENLREALELYIEEVPETLEALEQLDKSIVGMLEVEAKAPKAVSA